MVARVILLRKLAYGFADRGVSMRMGGWEWGCEGEADHADRSHDPHDHLPSLGILSPFLFPISLATLNMVVMAIRSGTP